jgi:hypothetical protein
MRRTLNLKKEDKLPKAIYVGQYKNGELTWTWGTKRHRDCGCSDCVGNSPIVRNHKYVLVEQPKRGEKLLRKLRKKYPSGKYLN